MEKYFEINKDGHNVRCKLYYDKRRPVEKAVLYCHGFAGHKDNGAARKTAERILSKYKGVAVLVFDLPCHGDDVKKKLILADCMAYIETVVGYIRAEFQTGEIYSYATSFGGYLVLKYVSEYGNPFVRIALRCPAVNMAEVLTGAIMKNDELKMIKKGKTVRVGFDRTVEVNRQFIADLEGSDIQKLDFSGHSEDILIIHGTKDEVVPFETVKAFAEKNFIEFIPVENADHRFQDPVCMESATKAVLEFFCF